MNSERGPDWFRKGIAAALALATTGAVLPGAIAGFISLDGYLRRQEQRQFEQEQRSIVLRVETFAASGDDRNCIAEARHVLPYASVFQAAQVYRQICQNRLASAQLDQAQQQADRGELPQAIRSATQIVSGEARQAAQQRIEAWSERILADAERHYWQPQSQLDRALAIAATIPISSPTYLKARAKMQQWQQDEAANQQHWLAAQQALQQEQFDNALAHAQQISQHPSWKLQRDFMIQVVQEKQQQMHHDTTWKTAEDFLQQGEPENAIAMADRLPNEVPWGERKQQVIDKAEIRQRQIHFCRKASFGLMNCYEVVGEQSTVDQDKMLPDRQPSDS